MRTTDLMFSGVYLIILLIAFTQISNLNEIRSASVTSAKLYPQLVLGVGLLVGVIETVRTLVQKPPAEMPSFNEVWTQSFRARRMILLGLFVVYLFSIKALGFMTATGLFCFGTTLVLAPRVSSRSVLTAAVVALCTLALIYMLLVVYLQAFLP